MGDGITPNQQEKRMPFLTAYAVGLVKGRLESLESILRVRFGAAGLELIPELREIHDPELLRKILHRAETADSPDALRRVWTRKRRPKAAKSE
jgi:hypothetical protein